jgi:hypothetical protein
MKRAIFLSASVPAREPFVSRFDPLATREAILALVAVTVRERELVFGGHPAISPLVEHAARSLEALEQVHIYQSRFFEKDLPEAARKFPNLHWIEAVRETKDDLSESLEKMRREMIGSRDFCAAVFIGGMEGIFREHELFAERHREGRIIPVASTGGATEELIDQAREWADEQALKALMEEHRYRRLFRQVLPND